MNTTTESPAPESAPSKFGVAVAAVIGLVGIATGFSAFSLGLWTRLGPGPGFFPLILGVLLTLGAVFWGREQWKGLVSEDIDPNEVRNGPLRIIAIGGSIVIAALVLELLGFQITMLLFLLFHLRVLHRVRWIVAIPVTLVGSFGTFVLFHVLLAVHLPTSSIPLLAGLGL